MTHDKSFESEKNKKALMYTSIICGVLLLLFIFIRWSVLPLSVPVVQDLIEINLGNNEEGFGEKQPLIKGDRSPSQEAAIQPRQASPREAVIEKVDPDDNASDDAAAVIKPEKKTVKVKTESTPSPIVATLPKPQKPKITYNGPGSGNGNNATEDNGYRYQGNNPNGKGDAGDPNGNKDSYGNSPGGKVGGGPRVTKGNRKIVRYYSFTGDLPKATIYAIIKVSASGQGSFAGFDKGSTSRSQAYANQISNYLRNIQFDKSSDESNVTVQFNFTY